MQLDLVMTPRRVIVPATERDAERLRVFQPGDLLPVSVRKPRNGDHWRKFMALCAFVADNHPQFSDVDGVVSFLKYATKHYTPLICPGGEVIPLLKSISFDAMDEGEFREWSAQAKRVIFNDLFPKINRKRVLREINEWLEWA